MNIDTPKRRRLLRSVWACSNKLPTTRKVTVGFIKMNEVIAEHTHRKDRSKEELERIWRKKQLRFIQRLKQMQSGADADIYSNVEQS